MSQIQYRKLDHSLSVKFITAHASAFATYGLLNTQDANELRLKLAGLNLKQDSSFSTLEELFHSPDHFMTLTISRFGEVAFCKNFWRFCFLQLSKRLIAARSEAYENLLAKVPLFLNRPLGLYSPSGHKKTSETLLSTFITELSELMFELDKELSRSTRLLGKMEGCLFTPKQDKDVELDNAIATELGFSSVSYDEKFGGDIETYASNLFIQTLEHELKQLNKASQLIHRQVDKVDLAEFKTLYQRLGNKIQLIRSFQNIFDEDVFKQIEPARKSFVETFAAISDDMVLVYEEFSKIIHNCAGSTYLERHNELFTEQVKSSLIHNVLQSGFPALTAQDASEALIQYCLTHNVSPNEIIPAELAKIHPSLPTTALDTLKFFADQDNTANKAEAEKSTTLKKQQDLLSRFHKKLADLGIVGLFLLIFLGGCGVKLPPKSALSDPRAEPDYRSPTLSPDDSTQSTPQLPKDTRQDQDEKK